MLVRIKECPAGLESLFGDRDRRKATVNVRGNPQLRILSMIPYKLRLTNIKHFVRRRQKD